MTTTRPVVASCSDETLYDYTKELIRLSIGVYGEERVIEIIHDTIQKEMCGKGQRPWGGKGRGRMQPSDGKGYKKGWSLAQNPRRRPR